MPLQRRGYNQESLLLFILCSCLFIKVEGIVDEPRESNRYNGEGSTEMSDEARLIEKLLGKYKPYKTLSRPVLNSNDSVVVHFGLSLLQILKLDEKDQVLETRIWKQYVWVDKTLTWNPDEFGGCLEITLLTEYLWIPDIILWNNVDTPDLEEHNELAVVQHDGTVKWIPPVIYKSSCQVDMMDYPFDIQTCTLKFGSWTHNVKSVDLVFENNIQAMQLNHYVPSSEWDILENTAKRTVEKYECCDIAYGDLSFNLTLQRKVSFQTKLMLLPTILLSGISILIFWIPVNRPDRTSLGMSLFSSFFLLLIIIFNTSPPTASTKIGHFFSVVIILVTVGIMLSVVIINMSQSVRPVPRLVNMIVISHIGKMVCPEEMKKQIDKKENKEPDGNSSSNGSQALKEKCYYSPIHSQKYKRNDHEENMIKWKIFGIILDRLFFVIYSCAVLFSYIFLFPKPYMIVKLL